jgi:hypothetical protein
MSITSRELLRGLSRCRHRDALACVVDQHVDVPELADRSVAVQH